MTRETCLTCQQEIQRSWFSGLYVTRDGSAACATVEQVERDHGRAASGTGHTVYASHAMHDVTAS